ncbi:RNA polymerase II C-terminal domain phosphatase-like 4 isoform X5 [Manihot esculenta]|uniref:RNA polymerase II C-terminal domain phosphatase-like 4 isoform X5 n=1 Tax=Manihot esculenta TaxID=3983 RepID=UPI001CC3EDA1|nr:RNA polymerase II C-terminal domain phosphatase-like 4 isoform X5 [Manihot esculenta]
MSLATDSPVHSSSSGDFAAFLDAELDSISSDSSPNEEEVNDEFNSDSSDSSPNEEAENDSEIESQRIKRCRVETVENIEDPKGSTSHGSLEQNLVSSSKDACTHPGSFGDMCILCGQMLNEETGGVTFGYIHKLEPFYLLYIFVKWIDVSKGSLFKLDFLQMMTRLRPFVRMFLKEASQMFEMYIYTMGDRAYAMEMAKLLDPRREYFDARVISRDDGTQRHQKGLDIVLGQENAVLILDDTETAWTKHKGNLILMERYHFFASSCHQFGFNCKSLSELKSDESDRDGALASVLKVLRKIHHMFFDELVDNLDDRDVRQVLKIVRKDVLKGCKIVFTRVFPTQFQADNHHLWKMAEQLGATCSRDLDTSVTHVVSQDAGTEKSRWALKNKKFLVHPRWIEAANYLWQRQPEENFPVNQPKNH